MMNRIISYYNENAEAFYAGMFAPTVGCGAGLMH